MATTNGSTHVDWRRIGEDAGAETYAAIYPEARLPSDCADAEIRDEGLAVADSTIYAESAAVDGRVPDTSLGAFLDGFVAGYRAAGGR